MECGFIETPVNLNCENIEALEIQHTSENKVSTSVPLCAFLRHVVSLQSDNI